MNNSIDISWTLIAAVAALISTICAASQLGRNSQFERWGQWILSALLLTGSAALVAIIAIIDLWVNLLKSTSFADTPSSELAFVVMMTFFGVYLIGSARLLNEMK